MKTTSDKATTTAIRNRRAPVYEDCGRCDASGKIQVQVQGILGIYRDARICPDCKGEGRIRVAN